MSKRAGLTAFVEIRIFDGMSEETLTVQILRSIREEIRETRAEIQDLRADTNARFAETHARFGDTHRRLDLLAEGQIRTATALHSLQGEVHGLQAEVHGMRDDLARQGKRFDHHLTTSGDATRDLQRRVARLEDTVFPER